MPPSLPRQRILLLTPRWPYPPVGGDRLRIWHLAREVARQHDVTLLSLCQDAQELDSPLPEGVFSAAHRVHLPRWRSWAQVLAASVGTLPLQVAYYRSQAFQHLVDRLVPQHDLVWCHLARTASYAKDAPIPRWLEMTDAVSMTMDRAAHLRTFFADPRRIGYRLEAQRMRRYERALCQHFDLVTLISDVDCQAVLSNMSKARARMVVAPNGVRLPSATLAPAGERPAGIALIGRMDSMANRDALLYFAGDIFPHILRQVPHARLHIIGPARKADADRLRRVPGVVVEGVVSRLEDVLYKCRVGVCPVRFGAGVQNKVLDYMAHGLAIVTSPIGLEGLQADPQKDLVVATETAQWIEAVSRLLVDDGQASALGASGQSLLHERHSWATALSPAMEALTNVLNARPPPQPYAGGR
jgi:glycosyltransferase involved in cell wall biosynthesis